MDRRRAHQSRAGVIAVAITRRLAPVVLALPLAASASAWASAPTPAPVEAIRPPVLTGQQPAIYPEAERASGRVVEVALHVTVLADGRVGEDVEVATSGGAAFDRAAVEAVRGWSFAPARRGEQAIASRIRVSVRFTPPAPPNDAPPAEQPDPTNSTANATPAGGGGEEDGGEEDGGEEDGAEDRGGEELADDGAEDDDAIDIVVRGERALRDEDRGASSFTVDRALLDAAPRQEGADVVRSAPGVYIGRAEGMAVAHRYMLRGFDAEHGQDIEMRVGGLPINLPSHIHGQGYADLGFLIAEGVDELRALEGVYDPRQGDFAVAGSFDIRLGARERGWRLSSSYGRFNSFRQLAMWAPEDQPDETFAAVQYQRTDGFGQNRAGQQASGVVQARFGKQGAPWRFRVVSFMHGARSQLAGVVRQDDVDAGVVDFHGVYPYPTALAQSALAGRVMAGLFPEYRGARGDNGELGLWLGYDSFRLQENFTGFTQKSQTLESVAGRGDLVEQQNRTVSAGLSGRYRTRPYRPARWAAGTVELGLDSRLDRIEQAQNLLDAAVRNQTWDHRVDARALGLDLGMWGDLDWRFTQYLRLRVGARADVLFYDVDDRLGNFVPASRPDDAFLPGFRRTAYGVAAGPRTSAEVTPLDWLSIRAAYGEGYRSPQARTLEDGERAPFTKVRSADLGLRLGRDPRLEVTTAGYFTRLSDDVVFEPREARLERVGATRRLGAVLTAQTRPRPWLLAALSLTYVDATLLEPPPATAENPQPAFEPGQKLPFVAPVVGRLDLGVHGPLARAGTSWPLSGRLGAGFSYLSPRPLPYGGAADHVPLLDLSGGLRFGPLDLGVAVFNVLNREYAAVEYSFASHWNPARPRPRTPARHLAAGAPLSFLITLGVTL
ncbi:MAG: TonB-dependent receptor [Myxococcales bacterium]|nr:TonB-dependent receptor [Myxococcales bacterium]